MRKHMIHTMTTIITLVTACLVGCGGGSGSGGTSTKTSYFIDSAVGGLEYSSGSTTGITGADGSFKYEEGKPVTFKIGSMVLGSVTVTNNRVFPVDLVSGATDENNIAVTLMARLLQTLDTDNDPSNGITIDAHARAAIQQTLSFATDATDLERNINSLLNAATNNRAASLIDATNAKNHIRANLLAEYIGIWTGSYSGNDIGTCSITIAPPSVTSATNLSISGSCNSSVLNRDPEGIGEISTATLMSNGDFVGTLSNGATFSGQFNRKGSMAGTWTNTQFNIDGKWAMTKQ